LAALDRQAIDLSGGEGGSDEEGPPARSGGAPTLASLNGQLAQLFGVIEGADATPTTQAALAWHDLHASLTTLLGQWQQLEKGVGPLNEQLKQAGLPVLDTR
jgi:hypothetical protein